MAYKNLILEDFEICENTVILKLSDDKKLVLYPQDQDIENFDSEFINLDTLKGHRIDYIVERSTGTCEEGSKPYKYSCLNVYSEHQYYSKTLKYRDCSNKKAKIEISYNCNDSDEDIKIMWKLFHNDVLISQNNF